MMPQKVFSVQMPPPTGVATQSPDAASNEPDLILTPPPEPSRTSASESAARTVEINFSADRNQLFSAWNAIANLADLAGKVNVTVRADSAEGFDRKQATEWRAGIAARV
jgi:hypothetical protein